MGKFLAVVAVLMGTLLFGVDVPVNGTFENVGDNGWPTGWIRNIWSGYKPECKLETIVGGGRKGNSLRISDIQSKNGAAFNSTLYFPVSCGDTVRLSFRARGRGWATPGLFFLTTAREWNFKSTEKVAPFGVSDAWKRFTIPLKVLNGKAGETGFAQLTIVVNQGDELEISDLSVEVQEGTFRGSEPFPKSWTLFGPVADDYEPTATELSRIPETFGGVAGKEVALQKRTLDFAPILGAGEKKCGWAFAVLDSPIECDYTIGAGADWWMQYYVNGQVVLDTMETGNAVVPYGIDNHVATVRLKQGRNILAVKLRTGSKSSILMLGGPLELADRVVRVKLSKMEWTESFDGKEVTCGGSPELIKGYPTSGLLTLTGQGVFRTDSSLRIEQPAGAFANPENENAFRAVALRVQNFGAEPSESRLDFRLEDGGEALALQVLNHEDDDSMEIQVVDSGTLLETRKFSRTSLPAEFLFAVNAKRGCYAASVTSLADGSQLEFSGNTDFARAHEAMTPALEFQALKGAAEVTLDNYTVGQATEKGVASTVPYIVKPDPDFDPVKAGWKLVFDEEFEGDRLDDSVWYHGYTSYPPHVTVHDGLLEIKTDWNPEHEKLLTGAIYTYQYFPFGYFEARCKFRKEPGWWSAFWLYGPTNDNPFHDGFEIDIYEDYFLTSLNPGEPPRNVLDHNLHVYCGETLKSWNYNSPKGNYLDDFHTIACKWTPFEITYYLDGKLIESTANHSDYKNVTFDAFNHACGFTPLHPILSGQVKPSAGDPNRGHYPESFYTDYVRIYAMPTAELPSVSWTNVPDKSIANYGDTLEFSAAASPNEGTGAAIKAAYLFDGGYLIDYKTEPPYDFKVILTKEFYDVTDYNRPGRQGIVPKFEKNFHCYSVFVQDESGQVAFTPPWMLCLIQQPGLPPSAPYQGKAQVIPGRVEFSRFDEGGNGVAYFDTTAGDSFTRDHSRPQDDVDLDGDTIGYVCMGEWLNYTVDIQEAGTYKCTLPYGCPYTLEEYLNFYVDEEFVGKFAIVNEGARDHAINKVATTTMELPAGRHVLKMLFLSRPNVKHIDFELVK
ncbi:MAG: family 16 glycosylhydrolase [Lentisphaeria bacterium]|nr:family 16 glycosylhydrolase [Lentisphaeria bacterium]